MKQLQSFSPHWRKLGMDGRDSNLHAGSASVCLHAVHLLLLHTLHHDFTVATRSLLPSPVFSLWQSCSQNLNLHMQIVVSFSKRMPCMQSASYAYLTLPHMLLGRPACLPDNQGLHHVYCRH